MATNKQKSEEINFELDQIFNLSVPLCVIDKKYNIIKINDSFSSFLQLEEKEILNKKCFEIVPAHNCHSGNCTLQQIIMGETNWDYEKVLKRKDGTTASTIMRAVPYRNTHGEIVGIIENYTDISARKTVEQDLSESEIKYRTLFESSPYAILIMNFDGIILDCNKTVENISGFKSEDLIGNNYLNVSGIPEENTQIIVEDFKAIVKGETLHPREVQLFSKKGRRFWVNYHASILNFGKEDIIQVLIQDISNIRDTELELEKTQKNFKNIIENTKDAITIVGLNGEFIYISPQLSKLLDRQEIGAKVLFQYIHPDDLNRIVTGYKNSVQTRTSLNPEIEFRVKHKKGHYIWVASSSKNYYDEDGEHIGYISLLRDITAKKEAYDKIIKTEKKYRALFDNSPLGICLMTMDGVAIAINFKLEQILGYSLDKINSIGIEAIYDDPYHHLELMKILKKDNKVHNFEVKLKNTNGKLITALLNVDPIEWINQELLHTTINDITSRKEAEEKLKLTQFSIDSAYVGIYWLDEFGSFFYVNDAACRDLEYTRKELLSMAVYDVAPEFSKEIWPKFWENFRNKRTLTFETIHRTKSGKTLFVEINGTYLEYNGKGYGLALAPVITRRKKAEETIKNNEQFLSDIYNSIQDGMYVIDKDYNLIQANPTLKKWFSLNNSVSGKKCYKIFHSLEKPCDYCDTSLIIETLKSTTKIVPKNPKGELEGILEIHSYPFLDQTTGEVKGIIKIARDITEQQKLLEVQQDAERKLKESEEKFRLLFESISDPIHVVDADLKIMYINPAFEKWLKSLSLDLNIIGKTPVEAWPFVGVSVNEEYQKVFKTKLIHIKEDWAQIGNIKTFTETRKIPLIKSGNVVQVITIIRDFSKREKAELKLKESEEKYRTLVETSPNSIILSDLNGIALECNKVTENFLKLPKSEILGKSIVELFQITEGNPNLLIGQIFQLVKKGNFEPFEIKIIASEKVGTWFRNQFSLVKIEGKEYLQIVSEDITDKKNKENLTLKTIQSLKNLDEMKNEFLLRASHELKTPLTSIYTASAVLLDLYEDKYDQKTIKLLKVINNGGERLSELAKNFIDLVQIEYYEVNLELNKNNVKELIDQVITDLEGLFLDRDIVVTNEISIETTAKLDPMRIKQVFRNLISNAIKNTPPNGLITIKTEKKNGILIITIEDNGVGFTTEEMEKTFLKFGKIERYGKGLDIITEGSGLGLYLSKKIISLHNGNIYLKSKGRNLGTKAYIELPINPE